MMVTPLTESSKPEMPMPDAAAVPAKPMKWPELVMLFMMVMMMMVVVTIVKIMMVIVMVVLMTPHIKKPTHPIFEAKRLAPTSVQCIDRDARKYPPTLLLFDRHEA